MKKSLLLLLLSGFIASGQAVVNTVDSNGGLTITNIDVPNANTITNTTSETAFATMATVPPTMWQAGRHISLHVSGLFGTALVVPSITGKVKMGSVVIGNTGSITTAGSLTNKLWTGDLDIVVHTVGSSGTIDVQGCIIIQTLAGSQISLPIVNTADITVDMTVPQTFSLTATWGALSTSNTITLRQFILKF